MPVLDDEVRRICRDLIESHGAYDRGWRHGCVVGAIVAGAAVAMAWWIM